MRRTKVIFLIIFLISILLTTVGVEAVSSISLNSENVVKEGDNIVFEVEVNTNDTLIGGIQGKIQFDKNVLEYVSYEIEKNGWDVTGFNKETGIFLAEVKDIGDEESYIKNSDKLIKFTFKVKNNIEKDSTEVKVSDMVISGEGELENKEIIKNVNIELKKESQNITLDNNDENKLDESSKTEENDYLAEYPHTGLNFILFIIICGVIAGIIVLYKKNQKYKDI